MPELPEVETIARQIRQHFLEKKIVKVRARPARIFNNITASRFARALQGKVLQQVSRYGKFMYWKVEDVYPVFHLGMSGIFITDVTRSLYPRHIHISFYFEDGTELYFQDARKFGKVFLYHQPPDFSYLGIDPSHEKFTLNNFRKLLNLRKIGIKTLLMDQRVIAGMGNIYANEALFVAGIHPTRPANTLSPVEIRRLYRAVRKILRQAVERFGTTYSAYLTVSGTPGGNQDFLRVYQYAGEPCPRCGTIIEKMVINSRSTFYCPVCQS